MTDDRFKIIQVSITNLRKLYIIIQLFFLKFFPKILSPFWLEHILYDTRVHKHSIVNDNDLIPIRNNDALRVDL